MRGQGGFHQGAGQPGHGGQGTAAHPGEVGQLARHLCYGAGAESRGAEITNCGSCSSSGTFLFIKDLEKFYRKKSWLLKKI